MKKILFFLLLLPVLSNAKFFSGAINFNDGSSRSGLVEVPNGVAQSIRFKSSEDGKTEKFSIDDVTGFNITVDGQELEFKALITATPELFHDDLKVDKKKTWLMVETKGPLEMLSYTYFEESTPIGPGAVNKGNGKRTYYILWPENTYAVSFYFIYRGFGITVSNEYKSLMKITDHYFGKTCPALLTYFTKDVYKEAGVRGIVEYYNKNCAKP